MSLFVTASGTEVGKTLVSCALVRALRAAGRQVAAVKPVISGFDATPADATDTALLLAAQDLPANSATIDRISPWRFGAPLSPDMAAAREGRRIDYAALLAHCGEAIETYHDGVIIEGVGGAMVPLGDDVLVVDWIADLSVPAVLVAGSYLGTISHTLTALEVLQRRRIPIAGVVVSESPESPVPLRDTVDTISRFARGTRVLCVPRLDPEDHAAVARAGAPLLPLFDFPASVSPH